MALTQPYDFRGITIPAAYIRVDRIFGGKREGWNSVIGVYASAESAANGDEPLEQYNQPAEYADAEPNPYKLIYHQAKTDRFPKSKDC
jgi:hypothetical protein